MNAKNKPFFSLIIPTLNEEKYLPRLLQDLTDQTFTNFELIHVDGNSEDKTQAKAQKFATDLPHFQQITTSTRHVSHQRNLGAKSAQGKYLIFLDADVQLPPYFLEGLSYQLHRQPAGVFTTWATPDSNKNGDKALVTLINLALETSRLLEIPYINGPCMGCTPQAFQKTGGFDESIDYGEDSDFVKAAVSQNLDYQIYHQPRYTLSLRRFRSEGTLPTLRQFAAKELHSLTNGLTPKPKGYTMGGQAFHQKRGSRKLLQQLNQLFKQGRKQPKIKKLLRDLLTADQLDF